MKKIEKLTPEQEAYLPVFRQKYLDIATKGARVDRGKLETAITDAYAVIGKKKPLVVILDSPAACMMALGFLKKFAAGETGSSLWGQLWDQLRGQLRGQLWGQLWDQLGGQLRGQLWDQLRDQLWDQLWDQNVYDSNYLWGSQDLYWIAWARFAEHIGVKLKKETAEHLDIMERISTQCEWWWPYEGICVVSQRPTDVKFDDQRRLHSEAGPSVTYADGYSLYAWHGTRVPEEWIKNPGSLKAEDALKWENAEQRRAAFEIIGWEKFLKMMGAKLLDKDDDPTVGELYEVTHDAIGGTSKFLRMYCPTGRWFAEPVPPEMKTALEANAWGWDLPKEMYKPELQF